MMKLSFTDILVAYDIISMGALNENTAYIDLAREEIFYFFSGEPDEAILENYENIDDFLETPSLIQIPDYEELGISQRASQKEIDIALKKWCLDEELKLKM